MGIVSGIVVFVVVWWLVLFTVLPWGVRTPDRPEPGMAESAPVAPRLGIKAMITTAITAVIWVIVYLLVTYSDLTFRGLGS